MKKINALILFLVIALLGGCSLIKKGTFKAGVGTSYSQIGPQITLFRVKDAYGTERVVRAMSSVNTGPIKLSRLLNRGRFVIEWDLRNADEYLVELSVGRGNEIANSSAFYGVACTRDEKCESRAVKHCFLSPGLLMYCGKRGRSTNSFFATNISNQVGELPAYLTLFVKACNLGRTACDTKSINVVAE